MGWVGLGVGFCFVLFPPPLCSLCSQPCMRLGTGALGHPRGSWAGRDAGEKTLCHRMGLSRPPSRARVGRRVHRTHTPEKAALSQLQGYTCHQPSCHLPFQQTMMRKSTLPRLRPKVSGSRANEQEGPSPRGWHTGCSKPGPALGGEGDTLGGGAQTPQPGAERPYLQGHVAQPKARHRDPRPHCHTLHERQV